MTIVALRRAALPGLACLLLSWALSCAPRPWEIPEPEPAVEDVYRLALPFLDCAFTAYATARKGQPLFNPGQAVVACDDCAALLDPYRARLQAVTGDAAYARDEADAVMAFALGVMREASTP